MDDALADIVDSCLDRIAAGASVEDCLAAYPAERAELEPLLRVAARLRALPPPAPLPSAALVALEASVLASLRAAPPAPLSAAPPAPSAPPARLGPSALLAGALRALGYRGPLAQPWLRLGATALALLLALVLAATAYAAVRAILPDPPTPATLAPASEFELSGPIEAIDEDSLIVSGITVDLGPLTPISGTPALGAVAEVRGQIRDDGTLLATSVNVLAPAPTLTATAQATASPTAAPTAPAPTLTPAPTAAPTAPPAASDDPLVRLRLIIEAGQDDGRAGDAAGELLIILGEAEQALAAGNARRASELLIVLYLRIGELAREGRIEPSFAQETQLLIVVVGEVYQIRVVPGGNGGGGNGGGGNGGGGNGGGGNGGGGNGGGGNGGGDDDDDDGGGDDDD